MFKSWEKNKKDSRRNDERDTYNQQDNRKKIKLRPVEKSKYRLKGYDENTNDNEE